MPDTRTHRGAHPEDADLFAPQHHPALHAASRDLHWLLDHGYALPSSLALTGNRYALTQRQRLAVARCACSREQLDRRSAHRVELSAVANTNVWIDGYNLLITIESALAGGILLLGRDRCIRDMASLHGTYREVAETTRAATLIGSTLATLDVAHCRWLLDRPIHNSARLKSRLLTLAAEHQFPWQVDLVPSPDTLLANSTAIVATSDSIILDHCPRWLNLTPFLLSTHLPTAPILDLSATPESCR